MNIGGPVNLSLDMVDVAEQQHIGKYDAQLIDHQLLQTIYHRDRRTGTPIVVQPSIDGIGELSVPAIHRPPRISVMHHLAELRMPVAIGIDQSFFGSALADHPSERAFRLERVLPFRRSHKLSCVSTREHDEFSARSPNDEYWAMSTVLFHQESRKCVIHRPCATDQWASVSYRHLLIHTNTPRQNGDGGGGIIRSSRSIVQRKKVPVAVDCVKFVTLQRNTIARGTARSTC